MRKLVLFLLLFGLGLTAVILFQRRPEPPVAEPDVPGTREEPPPLDETPPGEPDPQAPPGSVGGRTTVTVWGGGEERRMRAYQFDADLEHLGQGRYLGRDVELEMYDSRDGTLLQTVEAERARLRIELDEHRSLRVGDGGAIELEEVVIVRQAASAFAPFEVHAPSFQGSLDDRTLRSGAGDMVEVRGRGLVGRGRDFTLREQASRIEFERGGEIELALEGGARARFATTGIGPIRVTRTEEVEERYALSAREGATVQFWEADAAEDATPSFEVDALRIDMRGERAAEGFRLERAEGVGQLELRRGADRFHGERGFAFFRADGRPERVEIEGTPRGEVWVQPEEGEEREPIEVRTQGEGKLEVDLGDRTSFDQAGPAELRVDAFGVVVRAQERLSGTIDRDAKIADFRALGAVRMTQTVVARVLDPATGEEREIPSERVLETDELTGTLATEGDGVLHAVALGRTHLLALDDVGDPVDVEARGRLELDVVGRAWAVPLAENVRVAREGPDAFQASAARVQDLDSTTRSFVVEGEVAYQSRLGHGNAVRATAHGPDHLELIGLPGDPASFFLGPRLPATPESASFEAQEIDVFPDRLEARGDAVALVRSVDRDYRLPAEFVRLTVEPRDEQTGTRAFTVECEDVVEARMSEPGRETVCSAQTLLAIGLLRERDEPKRRIETSRITATGRVEVRHTGEIDLAGAGELFTVDADGVGKLSTRDDRRVTAWGNFAGNALPYELTAKEVTFDPTALEAVDPRVFLDATLLPVHPGGEAVAGFTEARGDSLRVEREAIWLLGHEDGTLGHAHVEGLDRAGRKLELDAAAVRLDSLPRAAGGLEDQRWIRGIQATGGFQARYDNRGMASGETFDFTQERALLTGAPAHLALGGLHLTSAQIDLDLVSFLIRTPAGVMWSEVGDAPWRAEFASMQPIPRGGETLFVLREPMSVQSGVSTRAAWGVAWIDVEAWAERGNEVLWGRPRDGEEGELPVPRMPERDLVENPFRRLVTEEIGRYVEKLYLEGQVEILEGEERAARADALLVDLRENTGYMQNAEIVTSIDVFGDRERVRTRADTLRMAADGSLHAKRATLTSCEFAEPHYVVQTGDLSLDPRPDGGWRVSARRNLLRFGQGVQLPLPPIGGLVLDEEGDIQGFETASGEVWGVETVSAGESPRFGTSVSTGIRTEAGKVGLGVGKLAGFKGRTLRGRWKYDGSYLGSRGILLGIGLELRERNPEEPPDQQAWLNLYASGLSDSGRDRGYVRVDAEDRDSYRAWYRARGRYPLSSEEWVDVALSSQTDPGVQAEFFERLYTRFEQRDNELHYRRADGADYYQASVKARIDSFRTEVEELPSAGYFHGSTPIGRIGGLDVDYSGAIDVAYLRRREGTIGDPSDAQLLEGFTEFSEPVFTDGLGDREVARIDSSHQLAAPFGLGFGGLRATPFVETQLTAWDKGVVEEDQPRRAGFFGGMEVATTMWRYSGEWLTTVTPHVRWTEELGIEEGGGEPVRFDSIDDPIDGDQSEIGVRARWAQLSKPRSLDLDIRSIRRSDRTEDAEDMSLLAALAELRTELWGVPVAMRQDYQFDADDSETDYWRAAFGFEPIEPLQIELAYTKGPQVRDPLLAEALDVELSDPRFEAASGKMRYRLTPKWEVELSHTYSLTHDGRLDSDVILRRFDHDFLVEVGVGTRSGEGGTSFGLSFNPLVGWRPKRLGLLE